MDNNNKNDGRIHQILNYLASAATVAADGVTEAVQGAGNAVNESFNGVRMSFELNRLHDEQVRLFTDVGRTMFLIKTGSFEDGEASVDGETLNAQDTVDSLLEQAVEKQQKIDEVTTRRSAFYGKKVCPNCSNICSVKDVFCPQCGEKLPDDPGCACGFDDEDDKGGDA